MAQDNDFAAVHACIRISRRLCCIVDHDERDRADLQYAAPARPAADRRAAHKRSELQKGAGKAPRRAQCPADRRILHFPADSAVPADCSAPGIFYQRTPRHGRLCVRAVCVTFVAPYQRSELFLPACPADVHGAPGIMAASRHRQGHIHESDGTFDSQRRTDL